MVVLGTHKRMMVTAAMQIAILVRTVHGLSRGESDEILMGWQERPTVVDRPSVIYDGLTISSNARDETCLAA